MVRFHYHPPNWILQRIGGGSVGAAEGKGLCEALFELAKKLPERKGSKVAEKRKNFLKDFSIFQVAYPMELIQLLKLSGICH